MNRDTASITDNNTVEISVVIPCYNSLPSLAELHARLTAALQNTLSVSYEIIFVDDASPDTGVWECLRQLWKTDQHVRAIQLMTNQGQHRALLCGMRYAKGKFIVTIDDDLQHPPEEISILYKHIIAQGNTDAVVGKYIIKMHNPFRNLGTYISNRLSSYFFKKPFDLKLTSFRIIKFDTVQELLKINVHNPRIGHLLLMTTDRVQNVQVTHRPRKYGRSGYSLFRLVSNALDNLTSQSSLPLQLVGIFGLLFGTISLGGIVVVLYRYMHHDLYPGWTSLVILQLFFFGIIMVCFSVVGEYLVRIVRELQKPGDLPIREKLLQ